MPASRGAPTRHPRDLTGREDERLKREKADAIEQAGAEMAMAAPARRKRSRQVTDYTDAARPKPSPVPVTIEPAEPRTYIVRLVASIDDMTFGREIIDAGDFTDPSNPRMPIIGGLKTYNFIEGHQYKVDEALYQHLKGLGYLYEDEDDEE